MAISKSQRKTPFVWALKDNALARAEMLCQNCLVRAHLLLDNWTLQHVGQLLAEGFNKETVHDMQFTKNGQGFKYAEISGDLVKIECLLQLLNGVVFGDQLLVDKKFVSVWQDSQELGVLQQERVVVGKPFYDLAEKWIPAREVIARELCVCAKARKLHEANIKSWRKFQAEQTSQSGNVSSFALGQSKLADPLLSQLVWGGAGYLARANYFGIPYLPYPLRERLFVRAALLPGPVSAHQQLQDFVSGERMKLFKRIDASGYYARLNLPPVAVRVIQESSSPCDMLRVAIQLRDDYRKLRGWVGEFQRALDTEDVREVTARRKVFESVVKNVDAATKLSPDGETSLQFGFNWLKVVAKSGSPVNSARNLFGVRAAMNRLILAPAGQKAFRKLLGLFGERNSTLARDLERGFMNRPPSG